MGKCADCCKCLKIGSVMSALVTRAVFSMHCLIAFWRIMVTSVGNELYWLLLSGLVGLLFETLVTLVLRKGAEYKWFCPSVFFYLSTIVPCVWILELDMLDQRLFEKEGLERGLNSTHLLQRKNLRLIEDRGLTIPGINMTFLEGVPVPDIEPTQWVVMIEQVLLFILIFGRWMLPKGDITRDELSQLLLVYIGMAADIIEFFEAFKEEMVMYNWTLTVIILAIWSASLFQFTLVLTASKSKKSRAGFQAEKEAMEEEDSICCEACLCCGTEVFGILTTMMLQDGPFLILRLLLLVKYNVRSYMHIFFTVKNSLVLLLMFYRLFVLFDSGREAAKQRRKKSKQRNALRSADMENMVAHHDSDRDRYD